MNSINFNYDIIQGQIGTHPLIDINLINGINSISLRALVDTGAYFSVFHKHFAEEVGIKLYPHNKVSIIYGSGETIGLSAIVYLKIREKIFKCKVVFVDKLESPFVLLGRYSLFSKFNEVSFCEKINPPIVEFR